ncbi:MAG TPA: ABC transporter permease [Thermoplasmata archaeon]|nr:ABC transporter permease [Thermoplasmata archaeon]
MNPRRILAIALKSLSQFRHDRRTLGFIIGMPLLMVLAFGFTFGGQVHDVRVIVVDQDQGPLGPRFVANLSTGSTLAVASGSDLGAALSELRNGQDWAVLWIEPNFTREASGGHGMVDLYLDGTSPPITSAVDAKIDAALVATFSGTAGAPPVSVSQQFVYGSAGTTFIDSFAPGVMALAVLMVTSIFSVIVIVREKSTGMLERLFATPLRPIELVLGHATALSIVAVAQSAVVLAVTLLLFQVPVVGSVPLVFGILVLFAVGNQGLGIVASSAARSELQAVQFIPLILFPSLLLSGVFYPIEAIPGGLQPLSYFVPLTYASDGMHSVMLRGWGAGQIALDLVVLAGYAVATLLAASFFVRRQA